MKKHIILIVSIMFLLTGCKSNELTKHYTKQDLINYVFGQQVQDFLGMTNTTMKKCPLDSDTYSYCIAQLYKASTGDNIKVINNKYVDYTTKQQFVFNLDGDCQNKNNCYISYTLKNNPPIKIPVINKNGYLTTQKKYTMNEFKQMVKTVKQ